ncbi:hypothetical protein Anas_10936 [Armadillidium nasatum]|uniref:Uncharacterized protein n=1 Tax=Armadillidium nasatum TaxID=96803 RepID=A0A5N5T988_9CRUS|nr:hypothetical protein Anas_10936 [Armadillidium nasatum]
MGGIYKGKIIFHVTSLSKKYNVLKCDFQVQFCVYKWKKQSPEDNTLNNLALKGVASILNDFDASVFIKQSIKDMKMKPFSINFSTT